MTTNSTKVKVKNKNLPLDCVPPSTVYKTSRQKTLKIFQSSLFLPHLLCFSHLIFQRYVYCLRLLNGCLRILNLCSGLLNAYSGLLNACLGLLKIVSHFSSIQLCRYAYSYNWGWRQGFGRVGLANKEHSKKMGKDIEKAT